VLGYMVLGAVDVGSVLLVVETWAWSSVGVVVSTVSVLEALLCWSGSEMRTWPDDRLTPLVESLVDSAL